MGTSWRYNFFRFLDEEKLQAEIQKKILIDKMDIAISQASTKYDRSFQ